jgi:hypothetical protein
VRIRTCSERLLDDLVGERGSVGSTSRPSDLAVFRLMRSEHHVLMLRQQLRIDAAAQDSHIAPGRPDLCLAKSVKRSVGPTRVVVAKNLSSNEWVRIAADHSIT